MDKISKLIKPEDVFNIDDKETFPMAFLYALGVLEFKINILDDELKSGYSSKDVNEKTYSELTYLLNLTQYLYFIFEDDQYKKNQYEKEDDLFLLENCKDDLKKCKNTLIKYYKEYSGLQNLMNSDMFKKLQEND
jgi:hypothetical protein